MALQGAGDDRIKPVAVLQKVLAQAPTLLPTQRAELIVVVSAKRGLTVAYEVERSHGV